MNNNRGNNRRRGRGNNRPQGGQQMNRIDSRARGNAPQLLEKYKKMAHDAHLNGDRVQEEYYLQFADHYFRVIADQKQRQEESRQPRRDDRHSDGGEGDGHDDPRGEAHSSHGNYDSSYSRDRSPSDEQASANEDSSEEPSEANQSIYEPAENPFVRESRPARAAKPPRKPRRRTRDDDGEDDGKGESDQEAPTGNFDPATLPPSISSKTSAKSDGATKADVEADAGEEKPKRRRTRKAAPPADDTGGALEAVNG